MNNHKAVFKTGGISAEFIAGAIAKHQSNTAIGAHGAFLGQVRADAVGGKRVTAIAYTAYEEMAAQKLSEIRESAFAQFNLTCLHIYHSLGLVKAGEICLFVLVSSDRREAVCRATAYIVDEIKAKVPIFGKELFGDASHRWKVNR